ncbi:MAG: hypothetical protein KDD52_04765 [Bdellovibrionales bacterium]|nr:hypothetical protein [Bdellovibrionales bacterium]
MKVHVVKVGESALGRAKDLPQNLPLIKGFLEKKRKDDEKIILVLSALSGHSRKIRGIAQSLFVSAEKFEPILLPYGEFFSCKMLASYLQDQGLRACALIENQTPTKLEALEASYTFSSFDTDKIHQSLEHFDVVIVPGFVGLDSNQNYACLEFDGSDLITVELAKQFNEKICTFIKEPGAITIANRKHVPEAAFLEKLSYDEALMYGQFGSRVIHESALEKAREYEIEFILCNAVQTQHTHISHASGSEKIFAILYHCVDRVHWDLRVLHRNHLDQEDFLMRIAKIESILSCKTIIHKNRIEFFGLSKENLSRAMQDLYRLAS